MYTENNYKTKKALKEAVKNGEQVKVYQPGPFNVSQDSINGRVSVEGPHYPQPHSWYASVLVENGVIKKVLS